jgi:Protein of unknown function (DUF1579)
MSAFPEPHPKLRTLEPMVGRWRLHGRTDGAQEDDISGTIELDWLPGGHFLRQHTLIDFAGMVQVDGIELVGYEPETDSLASRVYSNVAPVPVPYHWALEGNELTIHMDAGATMRATISEDGRSFQGRWAPDPGHEDDPGMVAYEFAGSRLD